MLKPLEVYGKKFSKGFRGYEQEEVDKFLAEVAKDFEAIYEENMQLKEEAEINKGKLTQYQQLEKTMQNTLMIAQSTAEEIKSAAQKDKTILLSEAENKVREILAEGEQKAAARKAELNREIEEKEKASAYVAANMQTCIAQMKSLLEKQLQLLQDDDFCRELVEVEVNIELLRRPETEPQEEVSEEAGPELAEAAGNEEVSEALEMSDVAQEAQDKKE